MSSAESERPRVHWRELPIFPLANVQLFPYALLPLHVFEPRYRDMVRDALAGERLIAMASLEPGYEQNYEGRPAVRAVIGVGRLIGHEALPDGRSHILLRGVARARIERELPAERSYRLVDAQTLADEVRSPAACATARDTLVLLAQKLAERLPTGGATLRELLAAHTAPGELADVLAAALVTDAAQRQQLLETVDVAARIDRVAAEIASVLARLTASKGPAN
jgi:Lon protease-like protein